MTRDILQAIPWPHYTELRFDSKPPQRGLCGSPWHVAVASILLAHDTRVIGVLPEFFDRYPNPLLLAASGLDDLEDMFKLYKFHPQQLRKLQLLSLKWDSNSWEDVTDLPGVSHGIARAIQTFCF